MPTAVPELRHTPYDAARAGARMLASGWPDERCVAAALVEPVPAIVVTRIFEDLATRYAVIEDPGDSR